MKTKLLISFVFTFISIYSFSQSIELLNNNDAIAIINKVKALEKFNSQFNTKSNVIYLDSIIDIDSNEVWNSKCTLFYYNSFNKDTLDIELVQYINQSNWSKHKKRTYNYDNNGKLITICNYNVNTTNNWQITNKQTNIYNSNNLLIEQIDTVFSYNNSFSSIFNHAYTYDSLGNLLLYIYIKIDDSGSITPQLRIENEYNSQNLLSKSKIYLWNNNNWNYYNKRFYYYNVNAQIIRFLEYRTIDNGISWDTNIVSLSYYNSNGDLIQYLSTFINSKETYKTLYYYNTYHRQVEMIEYDSTRYSNSFQEDTRAVFVYDNNNNRIQTKTFNWDLTAHIWKSALKAEKTFQLNKLSSNTVYPNRLISYGFQNDNNICLTRSEFNFHSNQNQWHRNDSVRYFFSTNNNTSINAKKINNNISIYPNPAKNDFVIKTTNSLKRISIYNLQGKLIENQLVKDKENTYKLNVEGYNSGVYFIKLEFMNGQSLTKKLIKL